MRSEASEKTPPVSTLPTPWNNDWSLSDHLSDLQKHMDEMMSTMSPGTSFFNKQGLGYSLASPSIEMKEKSDKYEIIVKVPEGQEMEINTALKASNLTISGRVKNKVVETQEGQSSRIFQTSQFSQSIYLSEPIDESG